MVGTSCFCYELDLHGVPVRYWDMWGAGAWMRKCNKMSGAWWSLHGVDFLAVWGMIISAFLLLLTALRWSTNQEHSCKAQQVSSSSATEVGSSTWCGWVCKQKGPIDEGLILEGSIKEIPELKIQAHGICTKFLLTLQALVPINIEIWHFNSFVEHNHPPPPLWSRFTPNTCMN